MEDRLVPGKCPLTTNAPIQNNGEPKRPPSRLIPRICWVISGLSILGSLVWIAFAEDKGTGIFLGLAAVALSRVLLGDVGRWHEERYAASRRDQPADD